MQRDDTASVLIELIEQAQNAPGLAASKVLVSGKRLGVELNRGLSFFFVDDIGATTGEALAAVEEVEDDPMLGTNSREERPKVG